MLSTESRSGGSPCPEGPAVTSMASAAPAKTRVDRSALTAATLATDG